MMNPMKQSDLNKMRLFGGVNVPVNGGKAVLVLALLLWGGFARAQSNGVPTDTNYGAFSRFITQRNIFDPNRYPHETHVFHRTRSKQVNSSPAFTLVGTMSYGKGTFAFFSGNGEDFKKILPVSGTIASYEVTTITMTGATLRGTDKKTVQLNIGDQMRQENNGWQLVEAVDAGSSLSGGSTSGVSEAPDAAPWAPSASLGNNDILKRLMQLREQENK
jgi:hypothetical protein